MPKLLPVYNSIIKGKKFCSNLLSACVCAGHKAYLGFMYLDYTYNNAVVHVFLGILKHTLREHIFDSAGSLPSEGEEGRRSSASRYSSELQL